jgi:hypothetical protein
VPISHFKTSDQVRGQGKTRRKGEAMAEDGNDGTLEDWVFPQSPNLPPFHYSSIPGTIFP